MLDFLMISTKSSKRGVTEIFPKFIIKKSSDLMIRGGDFYAIWIEDKHIWSNDEQDALFLIDKELDKYAEENDFDSNVKVLHMWDASSGMIDIWHKYCQRQMRDNFHPLDDKLIFSDQEITKKDYATKKLNYPLIPSNIENYETLMNTLYKPEEKEKIEWGIGSVINGDSKKIQKFFVLYGSAGTGKSTVLNIIQKLFDGYYSVFDAKALGSSSNSFALESFRSNPLVAIQHDGDLSRIEDNTRLNSLVSHEDMTVNEKFKSTYTNSFKSLLFIGTNKPVKITDAKSGLMRRLIDVSPSGNKLSMSDYKKLVKAIDFELGGIACHCKEVYERDPEKYDDYTPIRMMSASNDFYNFMLESFYEFFDPNETTLQYAWDLYKKYCSDGKVAHMMPVRSFKEELKNYFEEYYERFNIEGKRVRNYYTKFKVEKFKEDTKSINKELKSTYKIELKEQESLFDKECSDLLAQYANDKETPSYKWDSVKTKLADISTKKLHYVKVQPNHIVIDFDIPGEDGEKSFKRNLEEANKWPRTYAELSKSGKGIHLHYYYSGDVSKLSRVYDDHIEVKIFNGNSSLRRKLTKCNDVPIATISSGLPLKGDEKMIDNKAVKDEKHLRILIKKCLNKEIHPNTTPNVSFIYKLLDDAYNAGVRYDVSDMRNYIITFASQSRHQSDYCIDLTTKMKFKSEEPSENWKATNDELIFFDCEVFPNLFLINWKKRGKNQSMVRMINPKPEEIEELLQFKLIGYNCRRYDNHILYAALMGYTNQQLFELSQKIVNGVNGALFSEAYNISHTDVYDYCSVKQSLKKWELQLGIRHVELNWPWDKPVPKEKWAEVSEYCDNDVISLEAVFENTQADFNARKMQVELVKKVHGIDNVCVNDSTNTLSTKLIFGKNRTPQSVFNYRDLSQPVSYKEYSSYIEKFGSDYKFQVFDENGIPTYKEYNGTDILPKGYSILPFFPGYKYKNGVSTYLGEEIGEGGRVYAEPGMYVDIWDGDIASMHPHSIIFECLFGPEYTKRFADIVNIRILIKHKKFKEVEALWDGALKPYLNEDQADNLAYALKIIINSIYGLTRAAFLNAFKDIRNKDNIVAKRGALFMTLLKQEVQKLGAQVVHIKTDSIKIPKCTKEIKEFIIKFGKAFGYTFETEAEYDRFCLVNDAVYIARNKEKEWTAVGAQFQHPYVYKKLFSKEKIIFDDMCEMKSVSNNSALYLDFNEDMPDVSIYEELKGYRSKMPDWTTQGIELSKKAEKMIKEYENLSNEQLDKEISKGHNYMFVGKNGSFCPVKQGTGGGYLLRCKDDKYYAAVGTKGYRWKESEIIRGEKESEVDKTYFDSLVDEAINTINQYGDFEWFAN